MAQKISSVDAITEVCHSSGEQHKIYLKNDQMSSDECAAMPIPATSGKKHYSFASFLQQLFLPKGYPTSVSNDYATYQRWDIMQQFGTMINTVICMHAMLKAAGVGDHSRSALASALAWVLKDGAGMIANIVFTWLNCRSFDGNMKQWRIAADVFCNVAFFIELLSSVLSTPSSYFVFASCASVVRSIVGVAGGATRVAVRQHQARAHNLADVMAKSGSQDTVVNLAALLTGSLLVSLTHDNTLGVFLLFSLTATLHVFANWHAVKSLRLESFNMHRLEIAVQSYIQCDKESAPTVAEVNDAEPISTYLVPEWLLGKVSEGRKTLPKSVAKPPTVYAGVSVESALQSSPTSHSRKMLSVATENYMDAAYVILMPDGSQTANAEVIYVFLKQGATEADIFRAIFDALYKFYDNGKTPGIARGGTGELDNVFRDFCEKCAKKGWNVDSHYLSVDEWRIVSPTICNSSYEECHDHHAVDVVPHDLQRAKKAA